MRCLPRLKQLPPVLCVSDNTMHRPISAPNPPPCRPQNLRYRHTRFFSRPPLATDAAPKPPTAADLDLSRPAARSEWPAPQQALHVLVSSDVRGRVCVSAYGQLRLATLDIGASCGLAGAAVQVGISASGV